MPFCNHCGEILAPGHISCPTCGQDPHGSSTSTIRDAASLHAKLEGFGAPHPPAFGETAPRGPARGHLLSEPAPAPSDEGTGTAGIAQRGMIDEFLQTEVGLDEVERKVRYLLRRADELVQTARTYRALRNKTQSRQSYMRALKYFEQVVALDPANPRGRQGRQECLERISS